jgi:hypothetical protein
MSTLYTLLEVSEQATPNELRQAYRRLVLLTHPDRTTDPAAHQRYLVVNEAYHILNNPTRRRTYDALLYAQRHPAPQPPPRHRDPALRRRPLVVVKQQRRARLTKEVDVRPYNRPALLWCRVLMGVALLVLLDYFGFAHTVHAEFVRLNTYRSQTGETVSNVVTQHGSFDTSHYFPEAVPPLELRTSWLFHFVHQARLPDGTLLPLEFSYGSIMSFTALLLLLTIIAQHPKVGPVVRVNITIVATVIGLIVSLMALVSN